MKAEKLVTDPGALTPVQRVMLGAPGRSRIWLKRDDLFSFAGARGCKARAARALLGGAKGATTAGNRRSPMLSRVARVCEELGIPCRGHIAASRVPTVQETDAAAHGCEVIRHKVAYLGALCGKARKDAEERGWTYIRLGMESREYVDLTARQVRNLPRSGWKRLVITVGSGMALSAVLRGLFQERFRQPVLGVTVGMSPRPCLERWAPQDWEERVELVEAGIPFEQPARVLERWGTLLDPHYEAKAAGFVRPGDLFWICSRRSVFELDAMQAV